MDLKELKELLALVSDNEIIEFELEQDGVKVRIRKGVEVPPAAPVPISPPVARAPSRIEQPGEASSTAPEKPVTKADDQPGLDGIAVVTSPMVGTFYHQPEPGADAFVKVGDRVSKGQVLCIIEAMKLMNEIESEHAGELVEVFVQNNQPVQFGDRLFAIRESG